MNQNIISEIDNGMQTNTTNKINTINDDEIFEIGKSKNTYTTMASKAVNFINESENTEIIDNNLKLKVRGDNFEREKAIELVAEKSPKLSLEVVNSTVLPLGLKLLITPFGIENSLRNKKDGFVYFGSQNDSKFPMNDYIIRLKEGENDEKNK